MGHFLYYFCKIRRFKLSKKAYLTLNYKFAQSDIYLNFRKIRSFSLITSVFILKRNINKIALLWFNRKFYKKINEKNFSGTIFINKKRLLLCSN